MSACAGTEFSDAVGDAVLITCTACGRAMTREELDAVNAENIHEHVEEIKGEAADQVAEELKKRLKDAFRGSKFVRIK
jgi:hypothetical protein